MVKRSMFLHGCSLACHDLCSSLALSSVLVILFILMLLMLSRTMYCSSCHTCFLQCNLQSDNVRKGIVYLIGRKDWKHSTHVLNHELPMGLCTTITAAFHVVKPQSRRMQHSVALMQVMADFGNTLDSTSLGHMPYADVTIKETLRYELVVGEVYRRATNTFECGGYTFPKVLPC